MKRYTKNELCLLIACFAAYTSAYISRCNLSPSLNAIAETFGISAAQAGLIPTCFAIPYAAGQIISGLLADRFPAPRLMLIGLLGSSLVNVVFSVSASFPLLVALWFVNGLLQSMIWTPIMRIIVSQFRETVRDHAAFFMSLALIFGYLLAWALSGLLTSLLSWRAAFLVSGLVTAAIAVPSILVINKIDRVEQKERLLEVIAAYQKEHHFDQVLPVSAKEGDGVEQLFDLLAPYQVESPWFFPEDAFTDQPERQIVGEILREKLLTCLDKEIPHGTAVSIEKFHEREDGVIHIEALIYCEKDSHKGIIIGKKGAMLKKISSQARADMEAFLDAKVFLQTWVKVKENWRDNPGLIRSFGFTED